MLTHAPSSFAVDAPRPVRAAVCNIRKVFMPSGGPPSPGAFQFQTSRRVLLELISSMLRCDEGRGGGRAVSLPPLCLKTLAACCRLLPPGRCVALPGRCLGSHHHHAGDLIVQPDLAASYTTIAEQGPDALYGVRISPPPPLPT
jgi:hypothetical protein